MGNVQRGLLLALVLVSACGRPFPDDPDDTSERVAQRGAVRVGITEHPPFAGRNAQGDPEGDEVEQVLQFAGARGVEVTWVWGQQEALFHALERRDLDLVVGGVHAHTPWSERLALTRPWREEPDPLVWALPPGENRWLVEVERFLGREVRP